MTLKEFVEDAVNKIPHPSVWGEVCDLVAQKVEQQKGTYKAQWAVDYFISLCKKRGYCK